jgi:hypothetical protein
MILKSKFDINFSTELTTVMMQRMQVSNGREKFLPIVRDKKSITYGKFQIDFDAMLVLH